jgi:chromosome segregation ATPase
MRECTAEARAIQQAADQLYTDAEAVERWLSSPEYRYEDLEADLDAIQETLTVVDEDVEALAGDENGDLEAPALSWLDATYRVRLTELLLVDVRADLDQLRQWDERDAVRSDTEDAIAPADLEERIDSLERDRARLRERLDSVADPTWSQRFDDAVSSFDAALAAHEPPVDWAALQATLEEHRERVRS